MQLTSIWHIQRTLSSVTTPDQIGSGSDGNEEVLRIPQSSNITGTSQSDRLVISRTFVGGGVLPPSAEKQSVYFTTPAD